MSGLSVGVEKELLVEAREIALGGDGEQLVGHRHHDAEIAGRVVGERDLELLSHESGISSRFEEMVEAGAKLFGGLVIEHEPAPNTTTEGHQVGRAESLGQSFIAGEDDAEKRAGIEVLAGKQAQLVEDIGAHLLGLINEEDGAEESGADVLVPTSAQCLEAAPPVRRSERDIEDIANLAIEIGDAALRVIDDTEHDVALFLQAVGQDAEDDGFARAWAASHHGKAAIGERHLDTTTECLDGQRYAHGLDRDARAEWIEFEPEEYQHLLEHWSSFSVVSSSVMMGEWGR